LRKGLVGMDVPRVIEPPKLWRLKSLPEDEPDDRFYTNEGCRFSPHYFSYDGGNDATEYVVDPCATNKLELFVVPDNHPAYPGMGVKALEALPKGTEIGYYTGIIAPSWFLEEDDNNAYVMIASPKPYNLVINAKRVGNILRYVNDPRGSGRKTNVKSGWITRGRDPNKFYFVLMIAKRDIAAGEELLLDYEDGNSDYWKAMSKHHQRVGKIIDLTVDEIVPVKRERQEGKEEENKNAKIEALPKKPKQSVGILTAYPDQLTLDDLLLRKSKKNKEEKYVVRILEHPDYGRREMRLTLIEGYYFVSRDFLDTHEIYYGDFIIFRKGDPVWYTLIKDNHNDYKFKTNGNIHAALYDSISLKYNLWKDVTKE